MSNIAKIQLKKIARPRTTVDLGDFLEKGGRQGRDLSPTEIVLVDAIPAFGSVEMVEINEVMIEI